MCLGIPGKILEIREHEGLPLAKVEFGGIAKEICLAYVPEAQVGDYVLVHVGFALSRIDEQEAQQLLDTVREIAEFSDGDDLEPLGPSASGDVVPEAAS